MEQGKEYYAFISYQRKDEEWADRLRNKLEHYRLPLSVRKQDASLPKEIRPIFRDALELAGGVLAKEIETALQQSKYLIVICSPNSAKSPWVNKEIQTFIDLGREDRIIPFIIDGTPFSDNEETECFPPALRSLKGEKELLGVNINELSRDAAAIKVVARMFSLKFDTLWQRYERERRRRRWIIIGGSLLFGIVSLAIGAYIIKQNRALDAKNKEVVAERDRANAERDRAEAANKSLQLANDNIRSQYALIEQQKDSISHQKDEIAAERDNVKSANYAMQVNLSRILANEASRLVDEGDSYLARLLALEALPPNRPYTMEAESALRKASRKESAILRGHSGWVNYATFSPDGKYIVSASNDSTIRIWDTTNGDQISKPLKVPGGFIQTVSFSPDGNRIVSASWDDTTRIWNAETGEQIGQLDGHTDNVNSAFFSRDGKSVVSASSDNTIRIWDAETGRQIGKPLLGHTRSVNFATFGPRGKRIVSASADSTIRIWDATTGKQIGSPFVGHSDEVTSCCYSPDGKRILSTSKDGTWRIWDLWSHKPYVVSQSERLLFMNHAVFSLDGKRVLSASSDNTIRIWDAETGKQIGQPLEGHTSSVCSAVYSPDGGSIVSASWDNTIRIWNLRPKEHVLGDNKVGVSAAKYSPDGKYVVSAADKTIYIWDVATGKQVGQPLKGHTEIVTSVTFSPDGKYIASSSSDSTICIWDALTGKQIGKPLADDMQQILSITFSPNCKYIISSSTDYLLRMWDVLTGKQVIEPIFEYDVGNMTAFSPDAQNFITASRSKVSIWNTTTWEKSYRNSGFLSNYIGISNDGKLIACQMQNEDVKIYNVNTNQQVGKSIRGNSSVRIAAFSPDGKFIALASIDGTIRICDIGTGLQLGDIIEAHTTTISSISFCPNGKHIMSASYDGTVKIWDFPSLQELIDETRERFKNRQLTPEERRKYYLE